MSRCVNHPDRAATHIDSVPDSTVEGINHGQNGYSFKYFCRECSESRKRNIGNTTRLQSIWPKCPKCGEVATYQTPDGRFWDSWPHDWYAEEVWQ